MHRDIAPCNRPPTINRLLGIGCLALSFLIIASIAGYALLSQFHVVTKSVDIILRRLPTQPVVTCKTPLHAAGDSTGSITSAGLKRTFLVHLAPSYGIQPQA